MLLLILLIVQLHLSMYSIFNYLVHSIGKPLCDRLKFSSVCRGISYMQTTLEIFFCLVFIFFHLDCCLQSCLPDDASAGPDYLNIIQPTQIYQTDDNTKTLIFFFIIKHFFQVEFFNIYLQISREFIYTFPVPSLRKGRKIN